VNLLKTSYRNHIKTPYDAPVGSVLVYEGYGAKKGGDRGYKSGNIEIRTEKGFISDYYSETARTGATSAGRSRRLIGVYIKPSKEIKNYLAVQ